MAANEPRTDPDLSAAKLASARRLVAKLEAAHHAGMLKPINPEAKPVTMAIRVKGTFPETEPAGSVSISAESFRELIYRQVEGWHEHPQPPDLWQWHSPVRRLKWQPQAFSPPPCATSWSRLARVTWWQFSRSLRA